MSIRLEFQKHFAKGKIVNLGCGDIPVDLGPNVVNVDIDKFDHPNFVQADIHNLPFNDNEFDTAVLGDILEHSPDPLQMIREASRVAVRLVATIFEHTEDVFPGVDGPERRGYATTEEWYNTIPGYAKCTEIVPDDKIPHHYHIQRFTNEDIFNYFLRANLEIEQYFKMQEGTENGKPYYNWLIVAHKRNSAFEPIINLERSELTDPEVPAIERGLLRIWHNDQINSGLNKIIEIGCNESNSCKVLSKKNFVVGIDVNPYRTRHYGLNNEIHENPDFLFIQGDASKVKLSKMFDLGIAISSIEHFGCGEYGDSIDEYGDKKAMENLWASIKDKGVVMVTVPLSNKEFHTVLGYIRRYDKEALRDRIIQGNRIQRFEIITHPNGPDFVGSHKDFDNFDFSNIDYKATIYLEMVKGE